MRLVLVSYQKELDCDPSFIGACAFRLYLWILQSDSCTRPIHNVHTHNLHIMSVRGTQQVHNYVI